MAQQKVTVSFYLEKTKPNSEGKCLIKMVVYSNPNKKRYSTDNHVTEAEWEKMNASNLRDNSLKTIKTKLGSTREKAEKIIEKMEHFSFVAFEEIYFENKPNNTSKLLKHWFDTYINEFKMNDQVGSASSYISTFNSLDKYKSNLMLQDITPAFLQSYENHMVKVGSSISTVGIYLRQLRAILNRAIKDGALPANLYPFKKYQIPASRNVKKALQEAELKILFNHIPAKSDEVKALDFWKLSYLCNGMNFADIIALKRDNINGNFLNFMRVKTIRTKKKDLTPIKVGLHPKAIVIIEKYKNPDTDSPYLFSILEPKLNAVTIKNRCKRFIKWVNLRMEKIRVDLNIDKDLNTYSARHSFSTTLMRKGISTQFIKESLGHSSIAVTENYLASFNDDVKLETINLLTDF